MKRCCPTRDPVRELSPHIGVIYALVFLISLFIRGDILKCTLTFMFLTYVVRISGIPTGFVKGKLGPVIVLLLFAITVGLFLAENNTILFR